MREVNAIMARSHDEVVGGQMIAHEKLSIINVILICASLGVAVMLAVNVTTFSERYDLDSGRVHDLMLPKLLKRGDGEIAQKVVTLESLAMTKKLFRPLSKPQTIQKNVVTIDTLTSDLLLIGVVKQEQPEAIIKNRRTRQTYFVKQGTSIGQLKVESVGDDKIVLSYENTKKELFIQ